MSDFCSLEQKFTQNTQCFVQNNEGIGGAVIRRYLRAFVCDANRVSGWIQVLPAGKEACERLIFGEFILAA